MRQLLIGFAAGAATVLAMAGVGGYVLLAPGEPVAPKVFAPVAETGAAPSLAEHTKIFERRIEEPTPGVHVAIGYGLANVIVIEADEGLILVDTLESIDAAETLLPWVSDLRRSTGKDITHIIYTHNHADHVFGAGVFVESQPTRPQIWAHMDTPGRVHDVVNVLRPIIFTRSMRQFGTYLPDEAFENAGIGPFLVSNHETSVDFIQPTDLIGHAAEVTLSGERVIFRHAIGETPDQLMIYLPDRKTLLPADNYYHAFPNLYAIRGTPYRDVRVWAQSIDAMMAMGAEVMIPQHTQPVIGADEITSRLTDYRDAIQYVHDQTVRWINHGLTPDEIVAKVQLPPHLATAPHLQQFYGRVDWSVRAVFSGTLGWFSGDPADLIPVSAPRRAALMARLAGGPAELRAEFETAMQAGEPEWALELATHLARLGEEDAPALRATALRALGEREVSATGRNYYLTMAAEVEGFTIPEIVSPRTPPRFLDGIPIENYLTSLQVRLKAEEVLDIETAFGLDFTDEPHPYTMRIRRGVATLERGLTEGRAGTLVATSGVFKRIAAGRLKPAAALVTGELQVDGGAAAMQTFLGYFE